MGPAELLQLIEELRPLEHRFRKADWKFIQSCVGNRCCRLLKNVACNRSWEDRHDTKEEDFNAQENDPLPHL